MADEEHNLDGLEGGFEATPDDSPARKNKKRRDTLRKAPQAPKRFKSSYICFFMAKQPEIKEAFGNKATISEISKRSAEMWKDLPADERAYWDDVASKDKERYMVEKASYTGPWQVPWKRAKKDPSAPKRPMSAFLYYSQGKRGLLKKQHPAMKNTEVSRLLGEMWRNASDSDKRPHIENEKEERGKYKTAIAEWRKESEEKQKAQKKAQVEWTDQTPMTAGHPQPPTQPMAFGDPYGAHHPQYMYQHPPMPYGYPGAGHYNYHPQQQQQQQAASRGGNQPVILGPNGVPHYHMPDFAPPESHFGLAHSPEYDSLDHAVAHTDYSDQVETLE
jgi:high mobility group protein B3